jgi:hypothetical protein
MANVEESLAARLKGAMGANAVDYVRHGTGGVRTAAAVEAPLGIWTCSARG